jgi:hypothetical protein
VSRRTLLNSVVALVAVLVTGVVAGRAVVSGPPSSHSASELIAEGVDGRSTVAVASTVTTAVPLPTPTVPVTRTATSRPPVTIATTPPPTDVPTPPPTAAAFPPAASPTVALPTVPPAPLFPSWTATQNGVTVTARIEPAVPRVGDTVTISYTAQGKGDFCCWIRIFGPNGTAIHEDPMPQGPCPVPAVTSGEVTVEMTTPGYFELSLSATRLENLCPGPDVAYSTAGVTGKFWVKPQV